MIAERPAPGAATVQVPMGDGVALAALRFPAASSPAPAVVVLTPYRKESFSAQIAPLLGRLDVELIVADVRGLGGSEGEWDGPLSPREISDGVELLEWVAAQPFCDGRTAILGPSYLGIGTLLIAARRPRGLRCAVALVPPIDMYRDMWRRGGIPSNVNWGAVVGFDNQHRPEAQRRVVEDFYLCTSFAAFDGPRFRSRSAEASLGEIEAPTLLVGGWYDYFLRSTLRAFQGLRAPKRLVVGNWGHEIDPDELGDEPAAWLGRWLCGEGDAPSAEASAALQCTGTGAWASCDGWPRVADVDWERWRPVTTPATFEVAVGRLPALAPTTRLPVPPHQDLAISSGMRSWSESWTADTPAVASPTRYRGPVALEAVLVSDAASDLDLHARISIVRADGAVDQVTEGRLRASHRAVDLSRSELTSAGEIVVPWHPHDRGEALPVGEPATLHVEVFAINLELAAGESLRLGLTFARADEVVAPAQVTLLPDTRVLLPRATA